MLNKNALWFAGATVLLGINFGNAQDHSETYVSPTRGEGNFEGRTDRPLRYQPDNGDFVIENGEEFFNRPLYGGHTAFRVDGGDQPELTVYAPGQAGNLRIGLRTASGALWLQSAQHRTTRYRGGSLLYEIRDPLLGDNAQLTITALALNAQEGLILRAQLKGEVTAGAELIWAYGGASGKRGARNGDIGTEAVPISQFFQLTPESCADNKFSLSRKGFELQSKIANLRGVASPGVKYSLADCKQWPEIDAVLQKQGSIQQPFVIARAPLETDQAIYFALTRDRALDVKQLASVFDAAEEARRTVAQRIVVETPDPYINSAMPALLTAADAIWDDEKNSFMHGAVAWRVPLLGWRGAYSGDALGWHDRARRYFDNWATKQNTSDAPAALPAQDHLANLARNEPGLHTRGDLSNSHYDMNLVYIDALFRHLLWTGDVDYARKMWPTIERHLEWERRSFRRTFGSKRLPLYEGYAAIWASDDLEYHGGGAAHASAYNYFHNVMAARIAKRIGKDAAPYETEAEQILTAMRELLWLPREGWYGEFKDSLGLQLVHPSAGLWSVYHAMDSQVTNPLDAWQLTRYVDTQIAHIPIKGAGVPAGYYTLPTTNWMPYTWSINNVVMAEAVHTSLAFWQAERSDEAFRLFKGALLDSMYLGLCPGNVGMTTAFDMARREAQRDFGDAIGVSSRTIIEGLFGVHPDALDSELLVKPGFPKEWTHARLQHPDFDFQFERTFGSGSQTDRYVIEPKWQTPMKLRLRAIAPLTRVAKVTVNGQTLAWRALDNSVGVPRIEIETPEAAEKYEVVITWGGAAPAVAQIAGSTKVGAVISGTTGAAQILDVANPQSALSKLQFKSNKLSGTVGGQAGARTVFAKVKQGDVIWWAPLAFEIKANPSREAVNWKALTSSKIRWRTVPLTEQFNAGVTQIFRNEYLRPRPQTVSLSIPKQGFGSWAHYDAEFEVDDSGLRAAAQSNNGKISVSGVPFATPAAVGERNIAFTSRWENYPAEISVPLSGKSKHAYFLMAGSTNWMQSRFDNAEIIVAYKDGGSERLALHNPTNWWPIDQDYFIDDYAFRRPEPIPPRVDLKTGEVRIQTLAQAKGHGGKIEGGAATVLDLPLNPARELKSVTLRTLSNEVVIGLMSLTLAPP